MTIKHDDEWIQIATLDDHDHIHFTPEYRDIMSELGWHAKAFAGHLLGLWYDPFEHLLDYTSGDARFTPDQPPGDFSNNWLEKPQEVVEYWAVEWSQHDSMHEPTHESGAGLGLDIEWYRDVLRAKLVSIRLPRRLLLTYKERFIAQQEAWGILGPSAP